MNGRGQVIRHTFRRKCRLRNSVSSHGAARGNVCIDGICVGLQCFLIVINLLKLIGCVCHNRMSMGRVTALVGIRLKFSRHQRAVLFDSRLHMAFNGMAHSRAGQSLFPGNLHTDAPSAHLGAEERI